VMDCVFPKSQLSTRLPITLALLAMVAFATACKKGPDFEPPATPSPADYRGAVPAGESVANVPWWELYQDPALQSLIESGLENNRSLREAAARIAESRASLGIVRADLYPSVTGVGVGFFQRTGQADSVSSFDNFKLAASAGYEIDLWGRMARSNEAAVQSLLATEEAYRTVTISLVAEIAGAYLVLRDLDARLELAEANVGSLSESFDLLEARASGGLVPTVAVNKAQVELADGEAVIQKLLRARAQTENVLSLLVGRLPGEVSRGVSLADQVFPPEVPAGLPSELLKRRPDVLAVERALHAQTALIGVADAARFPSLSLTSTLCIKTTSLGDITSTNSFLNVGANIIGPIFNAGKNTARVEVERARARVRQFEAAQEGLAAAEALFEGGLISYSEVLDLQRAQFGAQLMVSEALQLHHSAIVQLYKVLGGGWAVEDEGQVD